ncbi:hypothetical protein [Paraburkholderia tropica]|uniref:hypothetical protein n=1 Tax=Paraburkholderia tropica TaxID=92647 RepID=UPI003D27D9C2
MKLTNYREVKTREVPPLQARIPDDAKVQFLHIVVRDTGTKLDAELVCMRADRAATNTAA